MCNISKNIKQLVLHFIQYYSHSDTETMAFSKNVEMFMFDINLSSRKVIILHLISIIYT